jgi:hypothetical protein
MRLELEFDRAAHRYVLGGKEVPSVTTVLQSLEMFDGIPFHILDAARERGQFVHEAMALLVRGQLDWSSVDLSLLPYIEGGKRFLDESGIVVIASELPMGCAKLRYAGTLDIYGELRNSECIIDFKATAAVPPTVGPQTAAYDRLYQSKFGGKARKRYCVQLRPGDYRIHPLTDPADWSVFQSALNIHHWRTKHAA